jgi:hypothetical protein
MIRPTKTAKAAGFGALIAIALFASLQTQAQDKRENNQANTNRPVAAATAAAQQAPQNKHTTDQRTNGSDAPERPQTDWAAWIQAIGTVGAVIVAARSLHIFTRQTQATITALNLARRSANAAVHLVAVEKQQRRAWLSIERLEPMVVQILPNGEQLCIINGVVVNRGLMAATDIRVGIALELAAPVELPGGERPQPPPFDVGVHADLAPNGEQPFTKTIQRKKADPVCLIGRLEYDHGFGRGETAVCVYFLGDWNHPEMKPIRVTEGDNYIR